MLIPIQLLQVINMFRYQIIDKFDSIIWCGNGLKEAKTAFDKACNNIRCNYIKLQELKKDKYITIKAAMTY